MIRRAPWFIAIERDSFVALDMRLGLEEACPGSRIDTLPNASDLADFLASGGLPDPASAVPVVLTSLSLERIDEAGLEQLLDGRGVIIVQREGPDPVDRVSARGYLHLPSPFNSDDFRTLRDALNERLQNGAAGASSGPAACPSAVEPETQSTERS